MSQNPITGREEIVVPESSTGPIILAGRKREEVFLYDFAKMGGAIGDIYLLGNRLPKGAVATNSYMRVITAITGGATVAVTLESAGDVQAAAADSGAPWSTTGLKDTTNPEPGTEAGYILCTANRAPKITVSVAAITAGKFYVVLEYDVTE